MSGGAISPQAATGSGRQCKAVVQGELTLRLLALLPHGALVAAGGGAVLAEELLDGLKQRQVGRLALRQRGLQLRQDR